MNHPESCNVCNAGKAFETVGIRTYATQQGNIAIRNVKYMECTVCGETYYTKKQTEELEESLKKTNNTQM